MPHRADPAPNILPMVPSWPEALALGGGRKAVALAFGMQAQSLKTALRWQAGTLSFLARRNEATVQLLDDLAADEEFKDAFDIATAYMQNAALDWMNEAGRLAAIGPQSAAEAAAAIRQQAASAAEDLAAATVAA